jgi:Glycosyl-4,4'-diaponeurosporenoate acyltransferase
MNGTAMSAAQRIEKKERDRVGGLMLIGLLLFWLVPMIVVNIVTARQGGLIERFYARGWPVLYGLSLGAWWLPKSWFRPRAWEIRGEVYEALGVRWFKQFMVGGDRHHRRVRRHLKGYRAFAATDTRRGMAEFSIGTEKTHIIMFLFAFWPTLFSAIAGLWKYSCFVAVCNAVTNIYPIMLQRYTRSRITRIALRKNAQRM